jgi:ribonuclease E
VIDFIDMEENRNHVAVERRLKEALKNDRARIQVGRISPFGLLEMSRQRLRPSLVETSTQPCPHCGGTGFIRSTESTALYVLRSIEEEGLRRRSPEICVYVPTTVALYILNQKRDSLVQLETRYRLHVIVARDDALVPPAFRLERLRSYELAEPAIAPTVPLTQAPDIEEKEAEVEAETEDEAEQGAEAAESDHREQEGEEERARSRRRRRRTRSTTNREPCGHNRRYQRCRDRHRARDRGAGARSGCGARPDASRDRRFGNAASSFGRSHGESRGGRPGRAGAIGHQRDGANSENRVFR